MAAGVAGRAGFSIERIDDLSLALTAALRREPAGEQMVVRFHADGPSGLSVELGPLEPGTGERSLLALLTPLVDSAGLEHRGDGAWAVLTLSR